MVMWKVNAGRRSILAQDFLTHGVVAIGWREVGDPMAFRSKPDALRAVSEAYPEKTAQQNDVSASQIWRFINELKAGDEITTYDPIERAYHVGTIAGPPAYKPELISQLPTVREVTWTRAVGRDTLSATAKHKLGAILTLYLLSEVAAAELRGEGVDATSISDAARSEPMTISGKIDDLVDPFETIEDQAIERIKDRILSLGWDDMQELVAALLRALGYRTMISPSGSDRGRDIIASRDGLGLEPPRIVVEVKHRRGAMGAPEIRAFLGGCHANDRALYVSTGGFSREAQYEAERANTVTHLMTLDGLARALIEQYERIDERGRALLPLTRLYWPA